MDPKPPCPIIGQQADEGTGWLECVILWGPGPTKLHPSSISYPCVFLPNPLWRNVIRWQDHEGYQTREQRAPVVVDRLNAALENESFGCYYSCPPSILMISSIITLFNGYGCSQLQMCRSRSVISIPVNARNRTMSVRLSMFHTEYGASTA